MTAEPTTEGFTRILVATDFSPTSEGAWLAARRLAKRLGAEVVVLHVLVEAPLFSEGPFTMKHARNVFEAARAWVEKTLGEWAATATTGGVPARWTVRTGALWPHARPRADPPSACLVLRFRLASWLLSDRFESLARLGCKRNWSEKGGCHESDDAVDGDGQSEAGARALLRPVWRAEARRIPCNG